MRLRHGALRERGRMTISIADMASQAPSAQADLLKVQDFLKVNVTNIRSLIASSKCRTYDIWLQCAEKALEQTR